MSWPLSQDYNEAVQNPASSFSDPELRSGQAITNVLGMPMPRSGNFADVYEFVGGSGAKWAVKCFTRHVPGLRERYTEISATLLDAKLPFAVDFQYLAQGIRVRGDWFPILKMRWVDGYLLNEFVRDNLDKPALLGNLGLIWCRMAKRLREANIAHADLQHGNVILVPGIKASSLAVRLIDYDGMWVPALANKQSGEVGHPNYQHPQRLRDGSYSAEVDRFPLLVVATALRALVVGGRGLWERYDNGDNLLFREADLQAPDKSALFAELRQSADPKTRMLVEELYQSVHRNVEEVPAIDELLPEAKPTTAVRGPSESTAAASPAMATAIASTMPLEFTDGDAPILKRKMVAKNGAIPMWVWLGCGGIASAMVAVTVVAAVLIGFFRVGGNGPKNAVAIVEAQDLPSKDGPREDIPPIPSPKKGAIEEKDVIKSVDGFVPLFNGKDLAGWKTHPNRPGNWRVVNGVLVGTGTQTGLSSLFTERSNYKNFHLRVEARIDDGGHAGVYFRKPFNPEPSRCYEARINSTNVEKPKTGSLWPWFHGISEEDMAKLIVLDQRHKPEEWFTLEVIADGKHITILLNGEKTVDFTDRNNTYTVNHIALQPHNAAAVAEFRKIEIKELKPDPTPPAVVAASDFVPLFNGKDLTGWKSHPAQPGDWRVLNGVLTGSRVPSLLYTDRDNFENFHLRAEARIHDNGDSGIYFRVPFKIGPRDGYEAQINSSATDRAKTGSLFLFSETAGNLLVANASPDIFSKPGEWFTLDIIANSNRIQIKVDGRTTFVHTDKDARSFKGHVALQASPTQVEFRKVEIKELPPTKAMPFVVKRDVLKPTNANTAFVPLFNGKDLSGLRVEGKGGWKIGADGELVGQGPETGIITNRTDYKEFTVRMELSASADVEAFLVLRQRQGPKGDWRGMSTRVSGDGTIVSAGKADADSIANERGMKRLDFKPGEFFMLQARAKGDVIWIQTNKQVTAVVGFQPNRFPPGAIGLFVRKGTVKVKKFEVMESKPADPLAPIVEAKPIELKDEKGSATYTGILSSSDPDYQGQKKQHKLFLLPMEAGKIYQIDMESQAFDSHLFLEDPDATFLTQDHYGRGFPNARIIWKAAKTGTHRIIATHFDDRLGQFTLSTRQIVTDPPPKKKNGPVGAKVATTKSGVQYVDLQVGTREKAKAGDTVVLHYAGTLKNGVKFDSTADRNAPAVILLGKGATVKGLEDGIDGMKEGGKRKLIVPSKLGYGAKGFKPNEIPPNAELHYEVELLSVRTLYTASLLTTDVTYQLQKRVHKHCKLYLHAMEAGQTYQIDMISAAFDCYLYLHDPSGKLLAQDDDSGGRLNARITVRAMKTGTHRIVATQLDDKLGQFTLIIQRK